MRHFWLIFKHCVLAQMSSQSTICWTRMGMNMRSRLHDTKFDLSSPIIFHLRDCFNQRTSQWSLNTIFVFTALNKKFKLGPITSILQILTFILESTIFVIIHFESFLANGFPMIFDLLELSTYSRCLKITEKVSFNIASEASYVYILSGQKFLKNAKNGQFWRVFENLKFAVKQCYQTGHF